MLVFRDKLDITEKNVADVVVKKLAELDASKNMMQQYRQSIEVSQHPHYHSCLYSYAVQSKAIVLLPNNKLNRKR